MSDELLIRERNKEVAALTEEIRELRDLQRLIGSLVEAQGPGLSKVEAKVTEAEVKAAEGTEKIEKVYKSWWRCSIL